MKKQTNDNIDILNFTVSKHITQLIKCWELADQVEKVKEEKEQWIRRVKL